MMVRWIVPLLAGAMLATAPAAVSMERSSMDAQKAQSRKAIEMWSAQNPFEPDAVFTPDYKNHQEPLADGGVKVVDLATWESIVKANHAAFPDLSVEIYAQIGEGDRVSTYWRFSATQTGTYEGKAPSGTNVSWTGVQIDRFEGERIAESWVVWDKFTMFQTLGLIRE